MAERLAVFDLDGTMADTAPDLIGALNAVLRSEGLPTAAVETARSTAGRGGKALLRHGFEAAGRPIDEEGVDARFGPYLGYYEARITEQSRLFPGLEAALDALAAADWRFAVCTNKPERLALLFLERMGLLDRFVAVLGADTLPVRKPDPRHLLETIARAGGDPTRSVMIGDTETDRLAARNAGVPAVLVRFGYWPRPVSELAPEAEIGHFNELPPLLERMLPAPRPRP